MVRRKEKYLVHWKGCIVETNTQKRKENLGNVIDLVEKFKQEYGQGMERREIMKRQAV